MRRLARLLLQAWLVMFWTLLPSGCEHKDLCFGHPHSSAVRVTFGWDGIAGYGRPEGMRVVFFPVHGGERLVFDFPGGDGGTIRLPEGGYRVICFNYDTELIDWKNEDDHSAFTADTREILSPDKTPSCVTPDYLCGYSVDMFTTEASAEGKETVLPLYPETMVCRYTCEVNGLRNLRQVADVRIGLSGMNGSLHMASGTAPDGGSEAMLFRGTVTGEQIKGGCYTFGHSKSDGERQIFKLYVKTHSGETHVLEADVTEQVAESAPKPPAGDVHLVINLDYEIPDGPPIGGGAGFDVDADDWEDVNEDIYI